MKKRWILARILHRCQLIRIDRKLHTIEYKITYYKQATRIIGNKPYIMGIYEEN